MFEPLYEVSEHASLNFVGYMTDTKRYDFAIVHTGHFYGKPLVICMQSGRSSALNLDDLRHHEQLKRIYNLSDLADAEQLAEVLGQHLPASCCKDEI